MRVICVDEISSLNNLRRLNPPFSGLKKVSGLMGDNILNY